MVSRLYNDTSRGATHLAVSERDLDSFFVLHLDVLQEGIHLLFGFPLRLALPLGCLLGCSRPRRKGKVQLRATSNLASAPELELHGDCSGSGRVLGYCTRWQEHQLQ